MNLRSAVICVGIFAVACAGRSSDDTDQIGVAKIGVAVFPSDRYTVADASTRTGLRVAMPSDISDSVLKAFPQIPGELDSLDGFGTSAELWVQFDGPLDPSTLPTWDTSIDKSSSVQLIRLSDGIRQRLESRYTGEGHLLSIMPWGALQPGTRYALVLTHNLRDIEGFPLRAAPTIWAAGRLAEVRKYVSSPIVLASVFTTQSASETLGWLAQHPVAHTPNELPTTWTAGTASHVAWTGRGVLFSPDYRTEDSRFPDHLDDKKPTQKPADAQVPYVICLPKGATRAPIILVQHGLGGNKESQLLGSMCENLAALGFASMAMDAVWHGERGPGGKPPRLLDNLHTLFGIWTDGTNWTTKFRYGRDAFRQTSLDHTRLVEMIQSQGVTIDRVDAINALVVGDGVPDLSGEVFYFGESMGGIIGSMTLAVAPNIAAGVLNVPGARLSNFLYFSELNFSPLIVTPLLEATAGLDESSVRKFLSYFQTVFERADPINYAHHWWHAPYSGNAAKSVLVQETIDDVLVPNRTTEDLARAGVLPLLTPALRKSFDMPAVEVPEAGLTANLGAGISGGMVQLKTITRGAEVQQAEHGTMNTLEANAQAAAFFHGLLDMGSARIIRAY